MSTHCPRALRGITLHLAERTGKVQTHPSSVPTTLWLWLSGRPRPGERRGETAKQRFHLSRDSTVKRRGGAGRRGSTHPIGFQARDLAVLIKYPLNRRGGEGRSFRCGRAPRCRKRIPSQESSRTEKKFIRRRTGKNNCEATRSEGKSEASKSAYLSITRRRSVRAVAGGGRRLGEVDLVVVRKKWSSWYRAPAVWRGESRERKPPERKAEEGCGNLGGALPFRRIGLGSLVTSIEKGTRDERAITGVRHRVPQRASRRGSPDECERMYYDLSGRAKKSVSPGRNERDVRGGQRLRCDKRGQ